MLKQMYLLLFSVIILLSMQLKNQEALLSVTGEDGEPVSVEFLNASNRRLIRSDEVSTALQTDGVSI